MACLFLVAGGCATVPKAPKKSLPKKFLKEDLELRHEILSQLRLHNASTQSLRGLATIRYGKMFGSKGNAAILIKRPYFLRIDGLGEFGLSNYQILISRGDLVIYWPPANRYVKKIAGSDELGHYLSVYLGAEETIDLLSGAVPLEEEADYRLKRSKNGKELILKSGRQELVVVEREGTYLPVQLTTFDIGGSKSYRVNYEEYQDSFPTLIKARFWNPGRRVEIQFQETEINPKLGPSLFKLEIPDDATCIQEE